MPKSRVLFILPLLLLSFANYADTKAQNNQSMLVLDASGSMWGQIDGKTKIEIAREVVSNTVNSWDKDQLLGLIAYGHNRKSDCSDIEMLIEPQKVNSAEFTSIANQLKPKGKTPLSAAVKMAAEKLNYTQQQATVILVSDGKETCNLDPCTVGNALEKAGIDFTAHIIGFDVPKKDTLGLRCLAEQTGGAYLEADNAKQLEQALQQTREVVTDKSQIESSENQGAATLTVPLEVIAGSKFEIRWNGPKNPSDYLIIRSEDDKTGYAIAYIGAASESSPTSMFAPDETGIYTVHYKIKDKTSLASAKLRVTTPLAEVDAPDSVIAGAKFEVNWKGPNNEFDALRIFDKDGKEMHSFAMLKTKEFISPVSLIAPIKLGEYEVRYSSLSNKTFAKDSIKVTKAIATVSVQNEIEAGSPLSVNWTGPRNKNDRLRIIDGKGKMLNNYKFVQNKNVPNTVIMNAPDEPGQYIVAYHGSSKKILAQADLTVKPVTAMVTGPSTVKINAEYKVEWYGPNNKKDSIYTYTAAGKDARRFKFLGKKNSTSPITFKAPKKAGKYELRYQTKTKKVLATHQFTVQ